MKIKIFILFVTISIILYGCSNFNYEEITRKRAVDNNSGHVAATTPYGKYPELVKYTLGKVTSTNNSNMPSVDTYENNAYTRYLREKLNVQNENIFEADGTDNYDDVLSMAIASDQLPDVMIVNDYYTLQTLVENDMIEDLTNAYYNCASDRIKDIYESYGEQMLKNVTFNGRIMALPGTNIDNGPSLLWLRKDWMDKLGLKEPENLEDVCNIIKKFVNEDPGENGDGKTLGLVCSDELIGENIYEYEYQIDSIFAAFGAYPKQWIYDENGEVVYGSIQPEAKKALAKLADMYRDGIIDEDFLLRGKNNITDLLVEGYSGSFFGSWQAANNPLMFVRSKNPSAEWVPYLIQTDSDGSTSYATQSPFAGYVVVRKGYEHPEIVFKMASMIFDAGKYGKKDISDYCRLNVDMAANPLAINIDYKTSLLDSYHNIRDTLAGKLTLMDLEFPESAYYKSCNKYENEKNVMISDWAIYTSRITACSIIDKAKINKVESLFFGETASMKGRWWKMKDLEKSTYLAIVTGQKPVSYFDEFVRKWYEHGGIRIEQEVSLSVNRSQMNN